MWKIPHNICPTDQQVQFTATFRLGIWHLKECCPIKIQNSQDKQSDTLNIHLHYLVHAFGIHCQKYSLISVASKNLKKSYRVMLPFFTTFHLSKDIPAPTTTRFLTGTRTRLWLYSRGGWRRLPARTVCKAQPSYQVTKLSYKISLWSKPKPIKYYRKRFGQSWQFKRRD